VSLRLRQGWKRYWAQELWGDFFTTLLNHTSAAEPPPIRQLLRRFEDHLARNPAVVRKLQTELRKVVSPSWERLGLAGRLLHGADCRGTAAPFWVYAPWPLDEYLRWRPPTPWNLGAR
jgi:hypothetical protein